MPVDSEQRGWKSKVIIILHLDPKALLVLAAAMLCSFSAFALQATDARQNLAPLTEIYADDSGRLSLAQVQALPDDAWRTTDSTNISLGFTDTSYWFRMPVVNQSSQPRELYLEVGYARLDIVDAYIQTDSGLKAYQSGTSRPFRERVVDHRHHVFPVQLAAGERGEVWLRIRTTGSLVVPLSLWHQTSFLASEDNQTLLHGAYFGAWFMILIFNTVFYTAVPNKALVSFVAFVFSYGTYELAALGIGMGYLWSAYPGLLDIALAYGIGIAMLSLMWLTSNLLGLSEDNRFGLGILQAGAIAIVLLLAAYPIAGYQVVIPWLAAIVIPVIIVVFSLGLISTLRGNRIGLYATSAWSCLLLGVTSRVLTRFEILPLNFVTENIATVGFILMIFILSFVVAAELRRRAADEPLALFDIQSGNARAQLEGMVHDRTQELEDALTELSQANQTLREINTLDAVTGIKNRHYFDTIFEQEWRRASREKYSMSLLLLDIDHFKQVNDNYGHLAGDDCLRGVASTISSALKRPADIVARYGGEEFVAILPYTENHNALDFADRIRKQVAATTYLADGKEVKITLSIGVCTVVPSDDDDRRDMVAAADIALYEAKHAGRNQVRNAGQLTVHTGSAAS